MMDALNFKNCSLINFPKFGDNKRGYLSFFESKKECPFDIKRVYYIYGIGDSSEIRGPHAHWKTEQIFININGKSTYFLDDGKEKKNIIIDEPDVGIYIGPKIWHYMTDFSPNLVILIVASRYYDESDYIHNYDEFIKQSSNDK